MEEIDTAFPGWDWPGLAFPDRMGLAGIGILGDQGTVSLTYLEQVLRWTVSKQAHIYVEEREMRREKKVDGSRDACPSRLGETVSAPIG